MTHCYVINIRTVVPLECNRRQRYLLLSIPPFGNVDGGRGRGGVILGNIWYIQFWHVW